MKRILNLHDYGWKIFFVIGVFVFVIPSFLVLGSRLFPISNTSLETVNGLIEISVVVGIVLFSLFVILIAAEQVQDSIYDTVYQKNRPHKLKLRDGVYECQFCGNRKVSEHDRQCSVCGKELK